MYMDQFIKFVKPTPSEPVLLLLDNHGSHIDIEVVDKAKENGVIMLSFPPHCSHRLQPLDVGVYGPFKHYCATAQDNWMRNNPGKTMSIYEIPAIVKTKECVAISVDTGQYKERFPKNWCLSIQPTDFSRLRLCTIIRHRPYLH